MREISIRAGLSPNYLGMVMRGERRPGIDNLSAIARVLDVDIRILPGQNAGQDTPESIASIAAGA